MILLQTLQALRNEPPSAYPPPPDVVPLDERSDYLSALCKRHPFDRATIGHVCDGERWVRHRISSYLAYMQYGPCGG